MKVSISMETQDKMITTIYLARGQKEALRKLSKKTAVPISEYIRRAISAFLESKGSKK